MCIRDSSEYFRYIFRNNIELVSLEEEIHSVSSYIKLQQLYFSCWPELGIDISADTTDAVSYTHLDVYKRQVHD